MSRRTRKPTPGFLPPGSDAARKAGCKCPVLDNAFGAGFRGVPGIYAFSAACPIHTQYEHLKEKKE